MKRMFLAALILSAWLATAAEEPRTFDLQSPVTLKAQESFAGTWNIATVVPVGAAKDAKQLVFRKDWTYAALDKDGKELWAGTYELDPTATPPIWDHRSDDAKKKGGDALGIYDLKGDALKVSVVVGVWADKKWSGKARPTGFDPAGADATLELTRAK
jgi:uncharacterized protein (TIGR03067 family)